MVSLVSLNFLRAVINERFIELTMKLIGTLVILVLSLFCIISVVGHFCGYSITFPQFSITKGYDIPDHRLHAIRLSLMCTFIYFSFRYLFFGSEKLYPIQFMGVMVGTLTIVSTLSYLFRGVEASEYLPLFFYLPACLILYYAGKPQVRKIFFKKK